MSQGRSGERKGEDGELPRSERNVHVRRENRGRREKSRILESMLGFDVRKPHDPLCRDRTTSPGD